MKRKLILSTAVGMIAACAMLLLTGCEGDDHDNTDTVAGTGNSIVKGNVVDFGVDIVDSAVPSARIYLEGTNIESTTDRNGRFYFEDVPVGTYILVIEYGGQIVKIEITVTDRVRVEVRDITRNADGTIIDYDIIITPLGGGDDDDDDSGDAIDVSGDYDSSRAGQTQRNVKESLATHEPMTLVQNGNNITGAMYMDDSIHTAGPVIRYDLTGSINGRTVNITGVMRKGVAGNLILTGTVQDNGTITGTWSEYGDTGPWTATPR